MIEHITIRNFKSIGDVSVDLSPTTVFIGLSGVGKSNFLRAIRFVRNYLQLGDQAVELERGWSRIFPFGNPSAPTFLVRFRLPGFDEPFLYVLEWAIENHQPILAAERLSVGDTVVFSRVARSWKTPPPGVSSANADQNSYLGRLPTSTEAVLAFAAWTSGVGWHDFAANVLSPPNAQATPQQQGLDDTASNYLAVLKDLTQDLRNQRSRRQILARLKQLNPSIASVELDSVIKPGRVIVTHRLADNLVPLDLSQESDGFRRYFAHLLAIYQTPPKQLLMFEEPENGIAPGALRTLAEEFSAAPQAERGQVLLSTQSPDLLDGFDPAQIRVVDLDPATQLTRIGPLDADQVDAVRSHLLNPGELLTVDTARRQSGVTAG